jgi:hypothetical protein
MALLSSGETFTVQPKALGFSAPVEGSYAKIGRGPSATWSQERAVLHAA